MKPETSFEKHEPAGTPPVVSTDSITGDGPENVNVDTERLDKLVGSASEMGREIVDISGFLTILDAQSNTQLSELKVVREGTEHMLDANGQVREAVNGVNTTIEETRDRVISSTAFVREASGQTHHIAKWVQELDARTKSVLAIVEAVHTNTTQIASIAAQVNMLAINAKIEAARAGEAGKGFAVVAEAINSLSHQTSDAAKDITENISQLDKWITTLQTESEDVGKQASLVIGNAKKTDESLTKIEKQVEKAHEQAQHITLQSTKAREVMETFVPSLANIDKSAKKATQGIAQAHTRIESLIDLSETIVQKSVSIGGSSVDAPFIEFGQKTAKLIAEAFETAIERGQMTLASLLDEEYCEIPRTDPQQFKTKFTAFTDKVLPEFLELALAYDPRVVFCAAVDFNGYLPTHNKKFSKPLSSDSAWNAGNCRNRRIFNDRVGLKAGRNTDPFLLQVYRRDMGAGNYTMMKDLSAPIFVQGQHWGGLRLAYTF